MEIYRAAYRWTSEELATATIRHRDAELRPGLVRLVGVFLWLLSALVLSILFLPAPHDLGQERPPMLLCIPAFALYWTLFRNTLIKWQARWGFKKRPSADQLVEWELSLQELKVYRRGSSYSAVAWNQFVRVREVRDGFLLYTHPRIFHWLPFRAFESSEAPERVREFIRASGVPHTKIAR